jgi:phosphoglycolate phosphatase
VLGVKDTPWRKPDAEFTLHILKLLDATAEESLLVGDSPFDFDSATNVKMDCRLVSTGTHSAKQLEHLGALSIHEDLFSLAQEAWGLELR